MVNARKLRNDTTVVVDERGEKYTVLSEREGLVWARHTEDGTYHTFNQVQLDDMSVEDTRQDVTEQCNHVFENGQWVLYHGMQRVGDVAADYQVAGMKVFQMPTKEA